MLRKINASRGLASFSLVLVLAVAAALSHGGGQASATTCTKSGTLTANTTWTTACTYVVTNVVVPSGKTLTINAGVIIKVADSNNGIKVNSGGTLDVNGTSGSHVTFTSYHDDSVGGDTNGDGSSTSPAVSDYTSAISMNGGTASVSYTNFNYGSFEIYDKSSGTFLAEHSHLTVADSSFANSDVGIEQYYDDTLSLQRNSFALATSGGEDYAINVYSDPDVTGIVLSGTNKNTFSGSGYNLAVMVQGGTVPTSSTWTIDSSSGAALWTEGITVDGTLTLDSGVNMVDMGGSPAGVEVIGTMNMAGGDIVKATTGLNDIQVDSGGTLNVTGTSGSHVTFTSINDDTVGGANPNSTGSPAAADYRSGIALNGGTATVSYADFNYASYGVGDIDEAGDYLGSGSQLTVDDSSFTNSTEAASLNLDEQANFEDATVSNVSTGLNVQGTAVVTFRGSFSDISGKAIQSCAWGTDACSVDAAYTDWGSAGGPYASPSTDDMVCGTVTVSPWVHSATDYSNTTDMFNIPNCDESDATDVALSSAASSFSSALASAQLNCTNGETDWCTVASEYLTCFEDAVNAAYTATDSPFPLPESVHDIGEDANTGSGDVLGAASTTVNASEDASPVGFGLEFVSKVKHTVDFLVDMTNAYNECT